MLLPDHAPPIIAILRGVTPPEVLDVAAALFQAGVRGIEVPLNSPAALESIALLSARFGKTCLCGAGTVLRAAAVDEVHAAGGRLIVAPNVDPGVIRRACDLGLTVIPGFATVTEAFQAIDAGARILKLFPAGTYGPAHLRAVREVLPRDITILAVGGVGAATLAPWIAAGIDGFGVGGEIYRPGRTAAEVGHRASQLIGAYRGAIAAD